jgi:putative flippase GtrA
MGSISSQYFPSVRRWLLRQTAQRWWREFFRYFGASLIALAVDSATLVLLVEAFGLHYLAAATIAFTTGAAVLYVISVYWVFDHRRLVDRQWEFVLFALIGVAGLFVTIGVMGILTGWFQIDYRLSKAAAAGASFLFNFVFRKILLFSGVTKNAVL